MWMDKKISSKYFFRIKATADKRHFLSITSGPDNKIAGLYLTPLEHCTCTELQG